MSHHLKHLRIASPCNQRWADMVGDDRVRVCNGCDREVFDLSALTSEEATAVLATREVKPCVRFYRRADGTVMTADCPNGARPNGRLLAASAVAATTLCATSAVFAEPAETPVSDDDSADAQDYEMGEMVWDDDPVTLPHRPTIEWSSWFRLGLGAESTAPTDAGISRVITPPQAEHHRVWEAALGADASLPLALHGDLRLGAWAEVRTSSDAVLGGELIVDAVPRHLDLFFFDGQGTLAVRAGGNADVVTAAVAWGYLAPWNLFGPWNGHTRYMIGVRLVASATRSLEDPRDWSATAGIEVEPIGALRYLLGIRSWY